jgi:hypothetical protein
LDAADIYRSGSLDDTCHSILNLTVNPRGDVSPCCAGLDQVTAYTFGNIFRENLADIATRMNRSPIVRTLVFRGVRRLAALMEEGGVIMAGDFKSICHYCWSIFSSPQAVTALDEALRRRRHAAIVEAIQNLKTPEVAAEHA